ncbi:hypothetical protein BJ508DRAFT_32757 [Ascobolus immersus RN42]|uniref:Uncharacterized protein n=1 Tax=Ascobolus immersus RN42 TaxID=1160509 RepID=A0A3N4IES8_ASCIM|nr:hypothetical protein BJ508DRAFT_32757 [Ascobolus immersus RN42]
MRIGQNLHRQRYGAKTMSTTAFLFRKSKWGSIRTLQSFGRVISVTLANMDAMMPGMLTSASGSWLDWELLDIIGSICKGPFLGSSCGRARRQSTSGRLHETIVYR